METRVIVRATKLKTRMSATGTPRTTISAFPFEIQQTLSPKKRKSLIITDLNLSN